MLSVKVKLRNISARIRVGQMAVKVGQSWKKMPLGQILERDEGIGCRYLGKHIPGRESTPCNGPRWVLFGHVRGKERRRLGEIRVMGGRSRGPWGAA